MSYAELAAAARGQIGPYCHACPVCDGRACGAAIPGPGCKGSGTVAARNYDAWQRVLLNMDTIHEPFEATTAVSILGQNLSLPVMVAPVGDVRRHYGDKYATTEEYNALVLRGAAAAGTLAFTGDGMDPHILEAACELVSQLRGAGVPTVKPWSMDVVGEKLELALAAHPAFIAMDVDAAGLPFLRGHQPPAGAKSVTQLREIAERCHAEDVPFVLKGIMTPAGAEKAVDAGADGIVVSNHGGRVLDGTPATADVLPEIARAVGGDVTILVDGGIRSGLDVFRALALGADACLIARPFVVAAYGAGEQGVTDLLGMLQAELVDAMEMCGAAHVEDVTASMVRA